MFAGIFAITVPGVVKPLTDAVQVMLSEVLSVTVFVPPAVPVIATSIPVKVAGLIASLNTIVNRIGGLQAGSGLLAA